MRFTSLEQADAWKQRHQAQLADIHTEVQKVEGVTYSETWLCGNCPSHVLGISNDDQGAVCFPLHMNMKQEVS